VRYLCSSRSFGLRVPLSDVVSMQTRQPNLEGAGEIPLRRLVKEALRMRPCRIVVGEVRQEECLDLSQLPRSATASLLKPDKCSGAEPSRSPTDCTSDVLDVRR